MICRCKNCSCRLEEADQLECRGTLLLRGYSNHAIKLMMPVCGKCIDRLFPNIAEKKTRRKRKKWWAMKKRKSS